MSLKRDRSPQGEIVAGRGGGVQGQDIHIYGGDTLIIPMIHLYQKSYYCHNR